MDNTVFNGTFGLWRAWKLDAKGHRKECGIIPSQMKYVNVALNINISSFLYYLFFFLILILQLPRACF